MKLVNGTDNSEKRRQTLVLDFSKEEMSSYYSNQGKEIFEDKEELLQISKKLMEIQEHI